nr:MAG TPA: hypothetical protein [Bacteriophage sp.]
MNLCWLFDSKYVSHFVSHRLKLFNPKNPKSCKNVFG